MDRRFAGAGLSGRGRGSHNPPGGGGAAPISYLLDGLSSTIHGAYSLSDRLRAAYTGPLFRVERTDTTQFDVEAGVNGRANIAALETFLAGANGFVCEVYDQYTGAKHLTQATRANMPQVATAGVVDVRGALTCPVMFFSPTDFQHAQFLTRSDSFSLTGNPGISVWFNWETNTAGVHDDGFVWSVGNGVGAQYGTMRSWNNNNAPTYAPHRAISSTMAGNKTFVDASDETWGSLQHLWTNGGTVDAASIIRGVTTLTSDSVFNESTSPTLTAGYTTLGASSRSDHWFGANGRLSTCIFLGPTNPGGDVTALRTWFAARV